MQGFLDIFNQYAKSELMVLVPVLFVINRIILQSNIKNKHLPIITSAVSVALCSIYTFATVEIAGISEILLAIFASITQGILYAGASIFGGILINPSCISSVIKQKKSDSNGSETEK